MDAAYGVLRGSGDLGCENAGGGYREACKALQQPPARGDRSLYGVRFKQIGIGGKVRVRRVMQV